MSGMSPALISGYRIFGPCAPTDDHPLTRTHDSTTIRGDSPPDTEFMSDTPLSRAQLDQLRHSVSNATPIRKCASYARFSGWSTLLAGALTLVFGLGDTTALVLGLALSFIGFREITLSKRVLSLELGAPMKLAVNQLALGACLALYAVFSIVTHDPSDSVLASSITNDPALAQAPELAQLGDQLAGFEQMARYAVWILLVVVAVIMQGGTAIWYALKKSRLNAIHAHNEPWVLDVHRVMQGLEPVHTVGTQSDSENDHTQRFTRAAA